MPVKKLMIFLLAPLLGLGVAVFMFAGDMQAVILPVETVKVSVETVENELNLFGEEIAAVSNMAQFQESGYREQQATLEELAGKVSEQKNLSEQIYEDRILKMLGPPVKDYKSQRVEIKVFELKEIGYRGYIAKVKLFDPSAFKVVLAKDTLGEKETTLAAAERTGAILAINGGGFYSEMRDGKSYAQHIGNLIINGKLVGPFNPYPPDLHFAGIDREGRLIGGIFYEKDQLMGLNPMHGVSFIPILIKGGIVRPIHEDWKLTRQPRTIIGEYANGDLIMIVVDGRQSNWSSGVTLEDLLDKLVELGVKEGYNLDGGGSSTFVYDKEILNKPSDGSARPVVTNIVILP